MARGTRLAEEGWSAPLLCLHRHWNGLISGYYLERAKRFLAAAKLAATNASVERARFGTSRNGGWARVGCAQRVVWMADLVVMGGVPVEDENGGPLSLAASTWLTRRTRTALSQLPFHPLE